MRIVPGAHYKAKNGKCYFDFNLVRGGRFGAKSSIDAKVRSCGYWNEDGTFLGNYCQEYSLVQRINADGSDYVEPSVSDIMPPNTTTTSNQPICSCNFIALLQYGCKCGAIKPYEG